METAHAQVHAQTVYLLLVRVHGETVLNAFPDRNFKESR